MRAIYKPKELCDRKIFLNIDDPAAEAALVGKEATEAVFAEAAEAAEGEAPWRGKEGMSAEYSKHLAGVALRDALERAARFARERE